MTEAQRYLAEVFMANRVQERVLVVSHTPDSPVARALTPEQASFIAAYVLSGDGSATEWPDRLPHNSNVFDVVLLDGVPADWAVSSSDALAEAIRVLRPGGLLAGYMMLRGGLTREQVAENLRKGPAWPVGEFQIVPMKGDGKHTCLAFRLLKQPLPGLTLGYFCDGRGNDTLWRASKDMLPYADEVIVFDTGVDGDETRPHLDSAVAKNMGAKFFHVPWMDDFGRMANAIRYKASHEWIQILGDDCRIETKTAKRIVQAIGEVPDDIYSIQLSHKNVGPTWEEEDFFNWANAPPRTFRNRWWIFFTGHVHESITPAMGVAGFPPARHNYLIPRDEAYVIHWGLRCGETSAGKRDYYDALQARADPTRYALEYHASAQAFDETVYGSPAQTKRVKTIVENCKGDVLDLATGDGWILARIRDAGHEVTGVELSKIRRRRAKQNFGLDLLDGDVTKPLPFGDEEFDTVAGCEILEHLLNPGGCLEEMVRVSKKRVIISVPIAPGFDLDPHHKWAIRAHVIDGQMLVLVCDKINRDDEED